MNPVKNTHSRVRAVALCAALLFVAALCAGCASRCRATTHKKTNVSSRFVTVQCEKEQAHTGRHKKDGCTWSDAD